MVSIGCKPKGSSGSIPTVPILLFLLLLLITTQDTNPEPSRSTLPHDVTNQSLGAPLGHSIACPHSALRNSLATLIHPSDNDPRKAALKKEASLIYRLPNSVIKKVVPVSPSFPDQAKRRLLKELEFLSIFSLYRYFPRVISVDLEQSTFYMDDAGSALTRDTVPCDWRQQILAILHILRTHDVSHNDWLGLGWPESPNLCVKGGTLALIDFTWATLGADHYPFMNPTEELVYEAEDLWDLLERTRKLEEAKRLRYQSARDLYKQRHRGRDTHMEPMRPDLNVHWVRDKVGDQMELHELQGAALGAEGVAAEGLRVLVDARGLHPWCSVHCADCILSLTLDRSDVIATSRVCDCPRPGVCLLLSSIWELVEGRHVLEASLEERIGEGGDEAWWEVEVETEEEEEEPEDDSVEAVRVRKQPGSRAGQRKVVVTREVMFVVQS